MILTERQTDEGLLVAVCDPDVLGDTYENGTVSLTVTEEFYDGEEAVHDADPEAVVESLASCTTANLVGEDSVGLAIEHGFVAEENVLDLAGTPHAQLLWM
jgi:hypothetical protein